MNIKKLRNQKGLTQQDLADRIGMSRVSINRMENGKQSIEKRTLIALKNELQPKDS